MPDNQINTLTREVDLAYICRRCKTVFTKHYNVADIIKKRLHKRQYIDLENLTVAGLGLPRILYCPGGECRRNRYANKS